MDTNHVGTETAAELPEARVHLLQDHENRWIFIYPSECSGRLQQQLLVMTYKTEVSRIDSKPLSAADISMLHVNALSIAED